MLYAFAVCLCKRGENRVLLPVWRRKPQTTNQSIPAPRNMKKRHTIQVQQVGQTGVLFTFHVQSNASVIVPAEPRKNGVWLQKCVAPNTKPTQIPKESHIEQGTRPVRTKITIAELLNPNTEAGVNNWFHCYMLMVPCFNQTRKFQSSDKIVPLCHVYANSHKNDKVG